MSFDASLDLRTDAHAGVRRLRLAVLNTHPVQYFAPLYAHLGVHHAIDVTAFYLSTPAQGARPDPGFARSIAWDVDLFSGHEFEFLGGRGGSTPGSAGASRAFSVLLTRLNSGAFDALLVHGHNLQAHWAAIAAARLARVPVLFRGETHLGLARSPWRQAVRTPLVKALFQLCDGVLAIGSANACYYREMGVPERRIHLAPYTVDNDRIAAASRLSDGQKSSLRRSLDLEGDKQTILFAAKLENRKRAHDLLLAFARLRAASERMQLLIVGSGAEERRLRELAKEQAIPDVTFAGFRNQSELPAIYGASDVFVLPSDNEPWGLAVNEAMATGLPIVVSRSAGCAEDLVQDGVNGFVFDAGDVDGLAQALSNVLSSESRSKNMGDASRARIATWSYRETGAGIRRAIESVRRTC